MRRTLAAVVVLSAQVAAAQPTPSRYPKPPVDEDRASEQRSFLWEAATHPAKAPYAAAVDAAERQLALRNVADAENLATQAIALVPDAPLAYDVRGRARFLGRQNWAGCADDLQAAIARAHDDKALAKHRDLRTNLAECQARANRLADAEATLTDAIAYAPHSAELWARLGEVRVTMGKLDEAIAAYDTAISEGGTATAILWQRAGAYDRARQPGDEDKGAVHDVRAALVQDRSMSQIDSTVIPLLGVGEADYLAGLANEDAEQPRVESALVHFRRFVALAPTSPWRRRADEHLRELAAAQLPEAIVRTSGNAPLDLDAAVKIVRAQMPHMRACLAKLPTSMVEVRITRSGPRATPAPNERIRYHAPPAGVQLTTLLDYDGLPAETDAAEKCLEPIADKLALPPIKDKETYYQVTFSVVAQ